MLNILTQQTSAHAFILGASLVGLALVLVVLGFLFSLAHQFVHDKDKRGPNPVLKPFSKDLVKFYPIIWGEDMTHPNKVWKYVKGEEHKDMNFHSIGNDVTTYHKSEVRDINRQHYSKFLAILGIMFFAPFIILVALEIYPVVLFVITVTALLHLARFVVRLTKKLTSHTVDPNAHKEGTTNA